MSHDASDITPLPLMPLLQGLGNEFDYFEPTPIENSYLAHALVDAQQGPTPQSSIDSVLSSLRYEQVSCGFNHTAAIVSYSTHV